TMARKTGARCEVALCLTGGRKGTGANVERDHTSPWREDMADANSIHMRGRSMSVRQMMRDVLIFLGLILSTGAAIADRPVTLQESERLQEALKEQGCSSGKVEFDDGKFEVDNAKCADGKTYDLEFDGSFRLIKKKAEHAQTGNGPAGKPLPKLVLFMVID